MVPLLSIRLESPIGFVSANSAAINSACSVHSPPEQVMPRINGILAFTFSAKASGVYSVILGLLVLGQALMQASQPQQRAAFQCIFPFS